MLLNLARATCINDAWQKLLTSYSNTALTNIHTPTWKGVRSKVAVSMFGDPEGQERLDNVIVGDFLS